MAELTLEPYAARVHWRFAEAQSAETWRELFAALLDGLAPACTGGGLHIIGHIKGLIVLPDGGFLRGSKVSDQYPADVEVEGAAAGLEAELEMSLNVLVYGPPLAETRRIVSQVAQATARRWNAEVRIDPLDGIAGLAAGHHHSHE